MRTPSRRSYSSAGRGEKVWDLKNPLFLPHFQSMCFVCFLGLSWYGLNVSFELILGQTTRLSDLPLTSACQTKLLVCLLPCQEDVQAIQWSKDGCRTWIQAITRYPILSFKSIFLFIHNSELYCCNIVLCLLLHGTVDFISEMTLLRIIYNNLSSRVVLFIPFYEMYTNSF